MSKEKTPQRIATGRRAYAFVEHSLMGTSWNNQTVSNWEQIADMLSVPRSALSALLEGDLASIDTIREKMADLLGPTTPDDQLDLFLPRE